MNRMILQLSAAAILLAGSFCAQASDRLEDGKQAYEAHCASCHDSGKSGAPVTRNADDWKNRSHLWDAVLAEHAEKGYLGMPARGGADIATKYDVQAAAEYMLSITHPGLPRD